MNLPKPPALPNIFPIPVPEWHPIARVFRMFQMLVLVLLITFIVAMFTVALLWWIGAIAERLMERRDPYYEFKKNGGRK